MKVYGGGVGKVMLMTGLGEDEAVKMDRRYNEMFPEASKLLNSATEKAKRFGWVKTYLGRRRRYVQGDRFYSALNSVLQGTAADIMKLKLLDVYNNRKELDIHLTATVHDEMIGDVGSPEAAVKFHELLNEQHSGLSLRVPITWETGVGKSWYTCSKKGVIADYAAPRQHRGLSDKEKHGH
jgi:DNA polymerase-1